MRKAFEVHHHTADEVHGYLQHALRMLDVEELPPEHHDQTLAALLQLIAGKQVWYEQVTPQGIRLGPNGLPLGN